MKLLKIIAGSIFFGLVVTASLVPSKEQMQCRRFQKLERAHRYASYGGGI
jgi:hypothetical protein